MTVDTKLRDGIIRAAVGLFRTHGYRATSLKEIIAAAKCSTGGFYHHFSSKDDLLFVIHDVFISDALDRCRAIRHRDAPAEERLGEIIVDVVKNVARWRDHVTVFFEERRFLSTQRFGIVLDKREEYNRLVYEIIAEGYRNGEFDVSLPIDIVAFGVYGMAHWTYQWMRPDDGLSAQEIGRNLARIILYGLAAEPDRARAAKTVARADASLAAGAGAGAEAAQRKRRAPVASSRD